MSLRTRLSLLTVGTLFVLLLAGGTFQYFALGTRLRADEAAALRQRFTQAVTTDLRLLPRRGVRAACTAGGVALAGGRLTAPAAQCLVDAISGPNVVAVALAPDGSPILSGEQVVGAGGSGGASDVATPLSQDAYTAAAAGRPRDYYLSPDGGMLYVLQPLRRAGRLVGILQIGEPTTQLVSAQRSLLVVLAIAVGALVLVAILVLPMLVGRALRPLTRVTEASTGLAAGDLDRRVEVPATNDEVGRLARAFNDMAASMQRAFRIRAESEAGVRAFLSDASHELRTPLTTLQGQLDLLGRGAADDPDARQVSLVSMRREVQRMATLVEDLLTLTRLDGHAANPGGATTRVDLDVLVAETVDEESVRSPDQHVRVLPGAPGSQAVDGDADELRRVVLNLATNAVKYAPGGTHTWRTAVDGADVVVSLADEGAGIPPESLPRIFDRFYRSPEAAGREGSGLGLAIVKSIVEAHGGTVVAASSVTGTTVTFRLPRAAAGQA